MGIYKQLNDVPSRSRLERFSSTFETRDVWDEFVNSRNPNFDSNAYRATLRKAGSAFTSYIESRGRHHACARPVDVEAWLAELTETRTLNTVYSEYWIRVEEFFTWLQRHPGYPHVYHPVWMAAASYPTAQALWAKKTGEQ
jgi:hypothetical protein